MSRAFFLAYVGLLVACSAARAQWENGSDGSDGAFNPAVSTEIDLSLAASLCDCDGDSQLDDPCRWDCPSPVPGRGVYDAEQWVIVFKYTTVDVPTGATITFNMHPSGAPVVWLATGDVGISGTIDLKGENSVNANPLSIPYYTRPGPGGFQGGQAGAGVASAYSRGLGPGSTNTPGNGRPAAHATVGIECFGNQGDGSTYGSNEMVPLIGGSGGAQSDLNPTLGGAGGAGGGAMLIASPTQITLGASGILDARGGNSLLDSSGARTGTGSGGGWRLRSETVSLASGSQVLAHGGSACSASFAGNGRVRIEANTISSLGTITGSQTFPGAPSVVFPASPPRLYVTTVCGQTPPADPIWGIHTSDIELSSASSCTVNISGKWDACGNCCRCSRAIPARGSIITVNSTPMIDAGGGLRMATANITFPGGRSELQLRANW